MSTVFSLRSRVAGPLPNGGFDTALLERGRQARNVCGVESLISRENAVWTNLHQQKRRRREQRAEALTSPAAW